MQLFVNIAWLGLSPDPIQSSPACDWNRDHKTRYRDVWKNKTECASTIIFYNSEMLANIDKKPLFSNTIHSTWKTK